MNMLNGFRKFISENNLIKTDEKILLAVSGGIDSMVMAHLFLQVGYNAGIIHCNFSLRAGESDKDEDLVRKYAESVRDICTDGSQRTKVFLV